MRAKTADEAHRLASTWQEVFQAAVLAYLQAQLTGSLQSALDQVQQAEAAFFQAQEALAAFDREHGLSVRQARLAHLEQELTSSESRLRALTLDLLPAERARLHFLTEALAQEPPLAAQLPALARVEVVSPSILPEAPVSPRPLLNMAVAAVLAFFAATFFVFLREWWTNPAEERPAER